VLVLILPVFLHIGPVRLPMRVSARTE
jgi:hypothetical protein